MSDVSETSHCICRERQSAIRSSLDGSHSRMSEVLLRSVEWDAHSTQLNVKDKVSVRNLQVTVNSGLDVWGRQKIQRALISVTLSLAQTLASAASADSLDSSTVDYGKLSKDIRANVQETVWLPPYDLAELIKARVYEVAKGPIAQEQATVQSVEIDICYPKGSMFGDGAGLSWSFMMAKSLQMEQEFAPMPQSRVLYLRNVRVPCLVGINANEREQKQPVVVSLWIERLPKHLSDAHSSLESVIVDVCGVKMDQGSAD